jgi:hypothetical protein
MKKKAYQEMRSLVLLTAVILVWAFVATCGGGGGGGSPSTGTVNTSISDPPTCQPPNGPFQNVWVTITRVRAHTSNNADPNDNGWVDLVDLRNNPKQIDLFSLESRTCVLTQLGSTSGIPAGQYQQIRLYLLSNSPGQGETTPPNNCSEGYNCVGFEGGSTEILNLSSEAQTGIKIPSGQIAGGKFTVLADQIIDLDIHFDACSSIVQQANGQYRLKPVLHAGEVSLNINSISGRVIENGNANTPIENAIVLIEQKNSENIDQVIMQKLTDSDGKFIFCPLPSGPYDVVVGGKMGGPIYVPTITLGVGLGTAMGDISLYAASGSATINGQVTAQTTPPGDEVDIDISALQNATPLVTPSLLVTVPVLQGSTPTTVTTVSGSADYTLLVPTGNPRVGSFSSAGTSYNQVSGDYLINAQASNCDQSSITKNPGEAIAFTGCSGN